MKPVRWLGLRSSIRTNDLFKSCGYNAPLYEKTLKGLSVHDDKIYRVSINNGKAVVFCFGVDMLDPQAEGEYDSVDDLPKWVQDRIAVLMITSAKPPTSEVEGIGRRIDENTFWLYAD